jgi:hypothetical protein
MPDEPDLNASTPRAVTLSQVDCGVGILIMYFSISSSGIFSSTRSIVMNDQSIAYFIIGLLIVTGSYLCYMRFRYNTWCLMPPEFSSVLKGNGSASVKVVVYAIIIYNFLYVPVAILGVNRSYNPANTKNLGLLLGFWVVLNVILLRVYQMLRGRDSGKPIEPGTSKKLAISAILLVAFLAIISLEGYFDQIKNPDDPFSEVPLIIISILICYFTYNVFRG